MTSEEIAELIGQVCNARPKAFVALYRETKPETFAICLRILNKDGGGSIARGLYQGLAARFRLRDLLGNAFVLCGDRAQPGDRYPESRKPVADELDSAYDLADSQLDPEATTVIRDEGRRIDTCMEQLEADRAVAVRRAYVEEAELSGTGR